MHTKHAAAQDRAVKKTSTSQRWFAGWYPKFMERAERNGQGAIRREQLTAASGRVLEIGAGNGFSVPHYPAGLAELVLLEPNPAFRTQLSERASTLEFPATVLDGDAHALPFADASFDTVTASLVFCSVTDPARALSEVYRVLRPGGQFLFHEHVRGGRVRGILQDIMAPLQRRLADGCYPNRDFESFIAGSPLHVVSLVHLKMPSSFPTITPLVVGSAVRTRVRSAV
jgi:ubiquinone/menaquinone biosynthesis C-methylase UbiE